jgi:nucleolar MIF4G domain-containing protein 1
MTGILNRLSSQTKDTTWRAIKVLYDQNSLTVCNTILRDCVQAFCVSPSLVRSGMIPDYVAVICALHFVVGKEVGAFMVEHFTKGFIQELNAINNNEASGTHEFVGNKKPINYLLLLIYMYNLRILHHTLVVDVMKLLSEVDNGSSLGSAQLNLPEHKVEMIVSIVDHCGFHLRADDPVGLSKIIAAVMSRSSVTIKSNSSESIGSGRMKFLLEALSDLKNNKSRRTQGPHKEAVQVLRRWIGSSVKSMQSEANSLDMSLHVSLKDLLDAEGTGRWWIAGASWKGLISDQPDQDEGHKTGGLNSKNDSAHEASPEQQHLLDMAKKLRFTTATRKSIFLVTMSSTDVFDAFERLNKLRLPGNSDREIIRVLLECCAQEGNYNAFYSELAAKFCKFNRQHKTTAQYSIYDFMKLLQDESEKVPKRRVVNVARLFCHLVTTFDLPLSMMKRLDMSSLNDNMNIFLSTFFMGLFTAKISEETFQNVLDRVATTKDFATARDNILYFLKASVYLKCYFKVVCYILHSQRHLTALPTDLEPSTLATAKSRRKITLKTMEMMTTLLEGVSGDMAGPDDDLMNDDDFANHNKKKRMRDTDL